MKYSFGNSEILLAVCRRAESKNINVLRMILSRMRSTSQIYSSHIEITENEISKVKPGWRIGVSCESFTNKATITAKDEDFKLGKMLFWRASECWNFVRNSECKVDKVNKTMSRWAFPEISAFVTMLSSGDGAGWSGTDATARIWMANSSEIGCKSTCHGWPIEGKLSGI